MTVKGSEKLFYLYNNDTNDFEEFDFDSTWMTDKNMNNGFPQLVNLPTCITLNKCVEIFELGESDRLYAYINGSNEIVTWSSDDNSIAAVSNDGIVTAKQSGVCTITATNSDGEKANCTIYVYGRASSLSLSESEIDLKRGASRELKAIQSPELADEIVVWSSNNENIATVNQNGVVTAKGKGSTTIYATTTLSGTRAECVVNVSSPITSIFLSASSKSIKIGNSDIITATLYPSDYEGDIVWSSSDESIATVDKYGKITAHKIGTAYITATATSGVTAQCKVTVTQPTTSIKLNKHEITTYVNSTYQLSASMIPLDTTDTITWSSSSTSYATVSSTGLVTGKRVGTATITARTSSGSTATCSVTVKAAPIESTSITLSNTYITLAPEDARALTATLLPSNTTETTLSWTSSNDDVATVDKNGVVTAVSNGFATIRGKTTNGLTSECVVKVVSATGTSVLLDNTKASPGGTAQVKANIVKNPGLSAYKFKVNYDADVLTPVSITPNVEFGGTFSTNLEDANRTELNVLWYSGNEDVVVNGELFTVNFKVNDSAAYGDSSIVSIEYGATDICDTSGNYIAIYTEDATVSVTDPRPGDIYEDNDVNVYDLTLLARYITSLETFTERQEEAADVNDDERVDILDVIRLAQYLVKWSGIELMSLDLYDEPEAPVISVGSASVNESNEAEIPVYIKNNSGILGYRFVLDYNAEDIEILSITPSDLINKDGFNHNLGAESQATDGLVVSCFASGNNITDDGVLFTIKVRYKNSVDTSVSPISVVDSFDNMGNENATYVTATYETGYALGSDYIVANKVVGDTNFSCALYFDDSYAEQSAKAIIAFYDGDGRMVQLMPKDITVKPGKVDLSVDYEKKAYSTYKLMIWEGIGNLKPITEVK
ncbi:MAG: Ig-like domain-containing protein [Clostridia bacterium]|nr:Ig-like domain-containing protein [Clostridia bacterium]